MKKLRITVDGRAYDVTVEVLEDDVQAMSAAPEAPRIAAPEAALPRSPRGNGGMGDPEAGVIRAPIAGTVQKVFVEAGKGVEARAPVLLLDAMKMDTYIYAPRGGIVAGVLVHVGEVVQVGQGLVQLGPEA